MIRLILRYGIVAGLVVAIPMAWLMMTAKASDAEPLGSMLVGYLTMLVALTAVFIGIKQYRDQVLGGAIRFLPALGVGLAISAVASLLYVIAWEISLAHSPFDFVAWYKNYLMETARSRSTPEAVAEGLAEAEAFATSYANPLVRIPLTFIEMFPVGVVVSLISAAVLRNSRVLPARAP